MQKKLLFLNVKQKKLLLCELLFNIPEKRIIDSHTFSRLYTPRLISHTVYTSLKSYLFSVFMIGIQCTVLFNSYNNLLIFKLKQTALEMCVNSNDIEECNSLCDLICLNML